MADPRVIVVGAGPAGVCAAEALVAAGLRPVLIEESTRDGGQIFRRQPAGFRRDYRKLYGSEAARARALHQRFDALTGHIDHRPDTLAFGLWERTLHLYTGRRAGTLDFDALLIASGATDRLFPILGWELAGVYSLGAAQIALKSQAVAIGRDVVLMGSGPLLYLLAVQYLDAGARLAAVVDTAPPGARLKAMPELLSRPLVMARGVALTARLALSSVPVHHGATPLEITGSAARGVEGIRIRTRHGEERMVACDAVAMGWHLRPETQLADLARCEFHHDALTGQWLPRLDAHGRSSVPGVYLAGDGARLLGGDGARVSGRLAALAVLADLGRGASSAEMHRLCRKLARFERFARGLSRAFPWPSHLAAAMPDTTVVCRCEAITAGDIRDAARDRGAVEVNRAKALSRVGMGRCQGRYCGHAAAAVIGAANGQALEAVGRLRGQAPVKPLVVDIESGATGNEAAA